MKTRLLIIIMLSILMSACFPLKSTADDNGDNECIPPLYDIAFPIVTPSTPDSATPRQIPPQGNWQIQDALPFPQDEFESIYMRPKQNELLFTGKFDKIFIYSIDNKQWKSYPIDDWIGGNFFIASDSTIWQPVISLPNSANSGKSYPLLRRFNDATGDFEFVEDGSGYLQARQVRVISNIAEDQSGLLWFFVEADKNTLVSFNVKTSRSQQHYYFKIAKGHPSLTIGLDGSVWFQDFFNNQLVQYIPSSQETRTYEYPEVGKSLSNFDRAGYIYMDRSGRLWLANYGWLEFSNNNSPKWHRIIESPVFVTDQSLFNSQYFMESPSSTYQSSNGWYWFTGRNGIVRLDLQKGPWCLMTTGKSEVVEDNEHNLWIAVFGHLYKYPLGH